MTQLYAKLERGVQRSLDRIVAHCASEFDCQVSLVTMLEDTRQCFLAAAGTDLVETEIEVSFCKRAVEQQGPMLVSDARSDPEFQANPFVTGEPFVRSYLGIPIRIETGEYLGALCLIDERPHRFEERHIPVLRRHAAYVEDLLRLHAFSSEASGLHSRIAAQNETLTKASHLWAQAERLAKIGTWELEIGTGKLHWSSEVFAIYGLPEGDLPTAEESVAFYTPEYRQTVRDCVAKAIIENSSFSYDADLMAADGTVKRVRAMGEYIATSPCRAARIVGVCQDISESYQNELALRRAADHDFLTGILNRLAFDRALKERLARMGPNRIGGALVLLDLNGFKDMNDTFGHLSGDRILVEIASRIARAAPAHSLVARWGGDEFAIILPDHYDAREAERAAEQMLDAIRHCCRIGGRSFDISATGGMALIDGGLGAPEIIRRADTALYHAKNTERGSLTAYCDRFDRLNAARQQAIDEVRDAINEGRMYAGYMPLVDLATGRTVGFEALMRVTSPSGGILTAGELAPALVDPLLSRKIDQRMLELVAGEAKMLAAAFPELAFISVNATEADLLSRDFAQRFVGMFLRHEVDPGIIMLEVTETMLSLEHTGPIRSVLDELRSHGVKIALDDFGTGYSSLSHLRDFPIDKVKLDLSFVQAIGEDRQSRTIVQAMIGMARNMGISVVAEGIETDEQRNILQLLQCEFGQGYLFGKARSVVEWTAGSPAVRHAHG